MVGFSAFVDQVIDNRVAHQQLTACRNGDSAAAVVDPGCAIEVLQCCAGICAQGGVLGGGIGVVLQRQAHRLASGAGHREHRVGRGFVDGDVVDAHRGHVVVQDGAGGRKTADRERQGLGAFNQGVVHGGCSDREAGHPRRHGDLSGGRVVGDAVAEGVVAVVGR